MKRKLTYVTSNQNKRQELDVLRAEWRFDDGRGIDEVFDLDVRPTSIDERLEIDIEVMVKHEAARAYEVVRVPCIVEHAGLVFDDFSESSYPGGLTKPMWNALGPRFLESICLRSRGATAKAVVGYCDGMTVQTFVGCSHGKVAAEPRGLRRFYWDTIFVPDDPKRQGPELTYAEIADHPDLGLRYKVVQLSQSAKAMRQCLEYIRGREPTLLWP